MGTVMATATGVAAIGVDPSCCVDAPALDEESVLEASLDDDLVLDFPLSAFDEPDFEAAGGGALELESELALESCPLPASWLLELLLAD
jgi:hypothetical protein